MEEFAFNILVGGTSHTGKSTLSASLATAFNYEVLSTDKMARHPGRPWPHARPHVAEFYRNLSADSIHTFLRHHHENLWPSVKRLVEDRLAAKTYCILEGSALRPEFLAEIAGPQNVCICLYASAELIQKRIYANSHYADLPPELRSLVDAFLERSVRDNEANALAAKQHGIQLIDVADETAIAQLKSKLIGDDRFPILKM